MDHTTQLATSANIAVFVMASPDAREIEFLDLKPRLASDSERETLAARWPERDLRPAGVIGRLPDGRVQMALTVPFGNIELAGLLHAFALYLDSAQPEPQLCMDDSVEWCERLFRLEDPRPYPHTS